MQGPARPKHPDGERLFPYQSGNTAPLPHPFYKKHDSTVPKKCRKTSQTPGFVKSPLNSFYRKRKIQENREGEKGRSGERRGVKKGEREKNEEHVKQSTKPRDLFFYLFRTDYERSASARYNTGWRGGGGRVGRGVAGVPKNGSQNKTPGKQRMVEMEAGGDGCACFTLIPWTGMKWKREETDGEGWCDGGWKKKKRAGVWVS